MLSEWASIDDRVMGGISQSEMREVDGHYVFSGTVSLENNGGFASVRSAISLANVKDDALVKLRIKGDGRRYQLRFRTTTRLDGVAYAVAFDTVENEVNVLSFRLREFVPVWRGRSVQQAPMLKWRDVTQLGFMITDKQQGQFALEVQEVTWGARD